jgi:hypothetical protein
LNRRPADVGRQAPSPAAGNVANVTSTPNLLETLMLDQDHELTILEGGYFAKVVFVGTMSCYLGDTASSPKPN